MDQTSVFSLAGPGRAGTAIAEALVRAGWTHARVAGRSPDAPSVLRAAARFGAEAVTLAEVGRGAHVVVVATPDAAVRTAAGALAPSLERRALVVHLAGSVGLEVFDALAAARPDARFGAVHPLQTLPGRPDDALRLAGAWFAVEGDPEAYRLVEAVGGRPFTVADRALNSPLDGAARALNSPLDGAARALYHAAATVASNHLVALMGQVERLATAAGVPPEAFGPLVEATLANVAASGAAAALTGPVARGDAETVARHLDALDDRERPAYRALAREALALTGRDDPALEALLEEPVREEAAAW